MSPAARQSSLAAASAAVASARHWARQTNRELASTILNQAGGDEKKAIQRYEWAQNREFRGKEVLFAKMARSADLFLAQEKSGAGGAMTAADSERMRTTATEYRNHRTTFDALPPRTRIDPPDDPMRPVPNLPAVNAAAKAQLTPELLASMSARGYTYENTATIVNVRHGETDGNVVRGGYFAGGLTGPHGAQLTEGAKDSASALVPEMRKVAPYISKVITSPTDRAQGTGARALQGVDNFAAGVEKVTEDDFAEHHVGGYFGLKKIAPGGASRISGLTGDRHGLNEDGKLGVDKNNQSRDYVAPLDTMYPNLPRVSPVTTEGRSESWEQMRIRVANAVQRDVLPTLAQGKNVLVFSHQYVVGNQDAFFYTDEAGAGVANDPLNTGHDVPNTAPQYWTMHVFRDASGHRVVVPAMAGQGQLAAPGKTPKGQTPPTGPTRGSATP